MIDTLQSSGKHDSFASKLESVNTRSKPNSDVESVSTSTLLDSERFSTTVDSVSTEHSKNLDVEVEMRKHRRWQSP